MFLGCNLSATLPRSTFTKYHLLDSQYPWEIRPVQTPKSELVNCAPSMELVLWQGQLMWPSWPSRRFRPQFVFYNSRIVLKQRWKLLISFLMENSIYTPQKKEGFRTKSKVVLKKKGALFGHSSARKDSCTTFKHTVFTPCLRTPPAIHGGWEKSPPAHGRTGVARSHIIHRARAHNHFCAKGSRLLVFHVYDAISTVEHWPTWMSQQI